MGTFYPNMACNQGVHRCSTLPSPPSSGPIGSDLFSVIVNKLHRKKVVGRWSADHLPTTY